MARTGMIGFVTVAGAVSVANLYYAQPLADTIARDFGTDAAGMSAALVGPQLGYAAGMLLLVPLCDVRERRGVIVTVAFVGAIALLAFALAPNLALLTCASLAIGLGTSIVQMLVPFAVGLGAPDQRGKIVGMVMGGVLAGILLSRTASGWLGSVIGWRAMFGAAAATMAMLAVLMRVVLPLSPATTTLPYRALLSSMWVIVRRERIVRRRAVIGALGFASFSVFWSTLAFYLAHGPIGGGSRLAGMLGILGLSGIVVAPISGRAAMRFSPARINMLALAVIAGSFAVFYASGSSLVILCVGVVLLDAGCQANHLTNQTVIFGLDPAERSRVNAIYMIGYFLGGALGTAVAAQAWQRGGWTWVCIAGAIAAVLAVPALRKSS